MESSTHTSDREVPYEKKIYLVGNGTWKTYTIGASLHRVWIGTVAEEYADTFSVPELRGHCKRNSLATRDNSPILQKKADTSNLIV